MNLSRIIALAAYYLFARYLPVSSSRYTGWTRPIRAAICKHIFKHAGKHINIEKGAFFGTGAELEIGDYSALGVNCLASGPIKIGRHVMIGPDVIILTQNHRFDRTDIPIQQQGYLPQEPVVIQDDVWIGTRAIILPGVNIETGAIVAAAAVVTKNVPPFAIVAGNPAKIIKHRNQSENNPA